MKVNPLVSKATNPIRSIVDDLVGKQNPAKELISLAQGDPTAYGQTTDANATLGVNIV